MTGLKRGTVTLIPHQPEWESLAQDTISEIKNILGDIADVQHVGSTAINGIHAKPIIDIAVGMRCDVAEVRKFDAQLASVGMIYRKEERPDALLYVIGDLKSDIITHHIHVVPFGCEEWNNYIRFRDALNASSELAAKYERLKLNLADSHASDRGAYTAAKAEFIASVLSLV